MASITVRLQTTGPMFLKGADPRGDPEFRAASIRGQLRFWLRAILGAETQDLNEIWRQESAIFGSTAAGSKVIVRVSKNGPIRHKTKKGDVESSEPVDRRYKPYLLPHRNNQQSPDFAIRPNTEITLTISTRHGVKLPQRAVDALSLWLLLGGVGKRSRRMFGGFSLCEPVDSKSAGTTTVPQWMRNLPDSSDAWVDTYKQELKRIAHSTSIRSPAFPVLHPDYCQVLVGTNLYESAVEANKHLFKELLRKKYLNDDTMFGFAGSGGRRGSPVIAQVRTLGEGKVFGVFTIFRSPINRPAGKPADWNIMNRFANDLQDSLHYGAQRVFGGPFA